MERLLLWLDELDDCWTMGRHCTDRIRRLSLQAGLAAALVLVLPNGWVRTSPYTGGLALLAAAAVLLWGLSVGAESLSRRASRPSA